MLEPTKTSRLKQDFQYLVYSIKTWQFWRTIGLMVIGSIAIALAVNGLLVNYKLFDGGVTETWAYRYRNSRNHRK